jgi:hypothetical protein
MAANATAQGRAASSGVPRSAMLGGAIEVSLSIAGLDVTNVHTLCTVDFQPWNACLRLGNCVFLGSEDLT